MTNMMRLGLAAVVAAMALTGCNCGTPPVDCANITVAFDGMTPAEGSTVSSPITASVTATNNKDGTPVTLTTATLDGAGASVTTNLSGATATFSFPASPASYTITATVVADTCTVSTAARAFTVKPDCIASVKEVHYPQDEQGNNDGSLNNVEYPLGSKIQVKVIADCPSPGLLVQVNGGTLADISSGTATLDVDGPSPDMSPFPILVDLKPNGGPPVTRDAAAKSTILINRTAPMCSNETKLINGPSDDLDTSKPQFQLNAVGAVGLNVASADFTITNPGSISPDMPANLMNGLVNAVFTLPATMDTTYDLVLTCKDGVGNTSVDLKHVRVDYVPPTVAIVTPAALPDGGSPTLTGSPYAVQVSTNADDGSLATLFITPVGGTRASKAMGTVSGGAVTLNAPFVDGTYLIEVTVTDLAGNSTTSSITVTVVLSGCGAVFTHPGVCQALITQTDYVFQTQSNPLCAGQAAKLRRADALPDGGLTTFADVVNSTVASTGQTNYPVTGLVNGNYTFRAEVTDLDGGISPVNCDVLVNLDRPRVVNPPTLATGSYVINQRSDANPAAAGSQQTISFIAVVPLGGQVDACVDSATFAPAGAQPCAGGPAGWFTLQSNITSAVTQLTLPEGQYQIKIVVVGGGTTIDSAPVPILVDVTAPCVSAAGVSLPQDGNSDNALNIAELNGAAPSFAFTLDPACGTATSAIVKNVVSGTSGLVVGSTAYSAALVPGSGAQTIALTQNVASTASLDTFVEVVDSNGNSNGYFGVNQNTKARRLVLVDRDAPSCTITQPSKASTLNLTDVTAVSGGYVLGATATTSADVRNIVFSLNSVTQTGAVSGGTASATLGISGTQTNQSLQASCTDAAANVTIASKSLSWDLDAPTCSIVSPSSGSTWTVTDIATTVNVTGAEGLFVAVHSDAQVQDVGALQVVNGVATGTLPYPNGTQTVTASVTDPAGNPCVPGTSTGVVVNSQSCGLVITSGYVNGSTTYINAAGAPGNVASITATTSNCSGRMVTLQRTTPAPATTVSTDVLTGGTVTFSGISVADGDVYTLTVTNSAGLPTSRSITVDISPPTAGPVSLNGTAAPTTAFFVVAAVGNARAGTAMYGSTYFADQDPATSGGQITLSLDVSNAIGGTADLLFGGQALTPPVSVAISTSPQTIVLPGTLPQRGNNLVTVLLKDAAGNSTKPLDQNATVDVIAPGTPVASIAYKALADGGTANREATIVTSWPAVFDDSTPGDTTAVAGYEIGWTTDSVNGNDALASVYDFDGGSVKSAGAIVAAANPSIDILVPPLNNYYVGVRARDQVYNYSTYSGPAVMPHKWDKQVLSLTGSTTFGNPTLSTPSLNAGTEADLVVGATSSSTPGSVNVYFGGPTLTSTSTCTLNGSTPCQQITAPDAIGNWFGWDVSVGYNVGDEAGENKPDLLIAQRSFPATGSYGRAFIYFGSTAASIDTTNFIEIRGDASNRIVSSVKMIGNIDGDVNGLSEIAFSVPTFNASHGRIYIFKGRTAAAWRAARTGTDATTMAKFIPLTSADYIIDGPATAYTTGTYYAAARNSITPIGDYNGDGYDDFTVTVEPSTVNKVQLWSGAGIAAASNPIANNNAARIQELVAPTVGTDTSVTSSFGTFAVGGVNVANGTKNDIVAGSIINGTVYVYADIDPTMSPPIATSPFLTISGPSRFGSGVSAGNLSTDGAPEILAGVDASPAGVPPIPPYAWVLWSQPTGFDHPLDFTTPVFWTSRFDGPTVAGTSNSAVGRYTAIGDTNGDGLADVILGDDINGRVYIFR